MGGEALNGTPVVANSYLMMVLQPKYQATMGMRNLRELKTMATTLDHLARGESGKAADLLAQRIKAIEKSMVDGDQWTRAQFCELIEAESATLLNKEEDFMMDREFELSKRLEPLRATRETAGPRSLVRTIVNGIRREKGNGNQRAKASGDGSVGSRSFLDAIYQR